MASEPAYPEPTARESGDESASSGDETSQQVAVSNVAKRRRPSIPQKTSCEMCKLRKVKCDKQEPACSWCARHNRECVYKGRRNPYIRTDQIIQLEAKVKRLDALLNALGRRVEEHLLHDHHGLVGGNFPASASISDRSTGPTLNSTAPSMTANDSNAMSVTFQDQYRDPHAHHQHQPSLPVMGEVDRTSVQSLLNFPSEPKGHSIAFPSPPDGSRSGRMVDSHLAAKGDFPPQEILYTLVDLYFKHTNTWLPILDRKTTFATFFGSTSLREADRVVLHAIVATTLRFCHDNRLTPEMKAHYHDLAKRKVELYALDNVNIEALRALLILIVDVLGTSDGPRGWKLLALTVQSARQLNLFTESRVFLAPMSGEMPKTDSVRMVALAQPDSFIEDEGRRRVAWTTYLLDRYATVTATSFDFMLHDKDVHRHLPCSYDLFSRQIPVETCLCPSWAMARSTGNTAGLFPNCDRCENLGSFSYHCQILRLLSGIHDFLKTPIDVTSPTAVHNWRAEYRALDDALNTWLQNLPGEYSRLSSLCHSDPASRVANWFMLHTVFVMAVVRLHSTAAYPATSMLRVAPSDGNGNGNGNGGGNGASNNGNNGHETIASPASSPQSAAASAAAESFFAPSFHATQRCLTAVNSLGDIVRDVHEVDGLDLLGPPFAFSLWMAARLLLVHAAATDAPVDPRIDFFIETLAHIGRYWEVAGNYAKILARVVRRGREGVMTFRAMRRTAYDLSAVASSTRTSGLEQTTTRFASLDELDCVDVFDYFNVPKIAPSTTDVIMSGQGMVDGAMSMHSSSDWLGYGS